MDSKDVFKGNNQSAFMRKMIVASLGMFYDRIKYPFYKENGEMEMRTVPFAIESGEKQWILDKFELKDLKCDNKQLNGSNDPIPRGILSPTGFSLQAEESLNDNIPVKIETSNGLEKSNLFTRLKTVQIQISFNIKIKCSDLNQLFLIEEALIESFDDVMVTNLSHNGVHPLTMQVQKDDAINVNKTIPFNWSDTKDYLIVEHSFRASAPFPKLNNFDAYAKKIDTFDANVSAE